MQVSIVIPVYNERHRLPDNLTATVDFLHSTFETSEIIIVEDGSEEPVADYIKSFHPVEGVEIRYHAHYPNRGKGFSVKEGVLLAEGELVAFLDADGSTPIEEMKKLIRAVSDGADVAFGSRAKPSKERVVEKSVVRYLMGTVFALIAARLTGLDAYDTMCGFKLFRKDVAKKLFSEMVITGYTFDVEILARAQKEGYRLAEIPINWHDVAGSKVSVFIETFRSLRDIIRISKLLK